MTVANLIRALIVFAAIMSIGLLASLRDASQTSLNSEKILDGETQQTGLNALVHASVRSLPFPVVMREEVSDFDVVGGNQSQRLSFDFTAFVDCTYRGPVDMFFALAIVSVEAFNRPSWIRKLDVMRSSIVSQDRAAQISVGPLQMQINNILEVLKRNHIAEGELNAFKDELIARLETSACDNLFLVGDHLSTHGAPSLSDQTFERHLTRLANIYRSGNTRDYTNGLYAQAVIGAYDLLEIQGGQRRYYTAGASSRVAFYDALYQVAFIEEGSGAAMRLVGSDCENQDATLVLRIGMASKPEFVINHERSLFYDNQASVLAEMFPNAAFVADGRTVNEFTRWFLRKNRDSRASVIQPSLSNDQNQKSENKAKDEPLPSPDKVAAIAFCPKPKK